MHLEHMIHAISLLLTAYVCKCECQSGNQREVEDACKIIGEIGRAHV